MLPYIAAAIALAFIFAGAYYLTETDAEYQERWKKHRDAYYGRKSKHEDE